MITWTEFREIIPGDELTLPSLERWKVIEVDPNWGSCGGNHLLGKITLEKEGAKFPLRGELLIIAWNQMIMLGKLGIWDWEHYCFLPDFNEACLRVCQT